MHTDAEMVTALREHASGLQTEVDRSRQAEEDLTDSLAEETQRGAQSDELFRLLVQSVSDCAIFVLDPDGRVATWNAGAERIKGYRAAEIVGRHFSTFYPPSDLRAARCALELEVAARDGRFEEEGWRVRKDGSQFWANVVISALRDHAGTLIGFAKVTRDLSERKRADEEQSKRLAAEERFRLLVESVSDYAIFIIDPRGVVQTWNKGAERIKGYTADEIIGCHFSRFYPEADVRAGKCERELETATREGRFEDEGWRARKDGSTFWANVVINAVHDSSGALIGFSKVTRDLTERKRAEEERAARLSAEQANRVKDEFLAMLGHELRNPLAPIVTALHLMKARPDAPSTRAQEVIERQVKHMMRLVDDLLDVSRIARGKVDLERRAVDVREVLEKALEIASPLLEQRGHHVELDVPDLPVVVDGDEARLTQVFANLLTNAAKYTDAGGHIFVEMRLAGDEIITEVRDDGIGMEPALLSKAFDLFVQGYQSPQRAVGGLGLGLTLVRTLVHQHGGQVEARSEGLGRGSTFVVRLPSIDASSAVPAIDADSHQVSLAENRQRILIVDDNEDARWLLGEFLIAAGHDVRVVGDPVSALDLVKVFEPHVAILDIGLPVMNGYELAVRLRAAVSGSHLRLIAVTGYGQPNDKQRSRDAGFDLHLVKPVSVHKLLEAVATPSDVPPIKTT
jgi:PAS domain S-box-containing protein